MIIIHDLIIYQNRISIKNVSIKKSFDKLLYIIRCNDKESKMKTKIAIRFTSELFFYLN